MSKLHMYGKVVKSRGSSGVKGAVIVIYVFVIRLL